MSHTKPEPSAKDDLPSEARVQGTTELQLRQDRLEQVRIPLEIRFENLLALFDSLVASSLRASAKSNNHYDKFIADSLNYDLSELRTWKEKIKAMMPNEESSRNSLRILDKLEGPVVATLLNIVGRMETDLWELSTDIADNNSIFSEQFRAACDRLETSIIRLLALHHELIAELTTREGDIRNILNGERDTKNHRLPVVCFDGGGVRSYSNLVIFEALMDEVRVVAEQSEGNANAQSIRPCDVFTYMFGSSSGGLVAIMLGRLKMTLEQCKEAFRTHAKSIFYRPQRLDYGLTTSKYSENDLVQATKTVIESFDPTPESQKWKRNMFAATAERCGCGVFAYTKPNDYVGEGVPYIFRTYNNTSSDARNPRKAHKCDIWEVVLATAAAPSYFPAAKVDGKEYLDGGFAANNPSEEAVTELLTLHPKNPICLVSIGSGKRKAVGDISSGVFGRYYYDYLNAAAFATNTESAHRHMRQIAASPDRLSYFRFDVSGLEDVLLDECTVKTRKQWLHVGKLHTIDFIELQTKQYLAQDETRISIRACAQMLVDSYYSSVGSSVSDRRA